MAGHVSSESWARDFEDAVRLADDISSLIEERNAAIQRREDATKLVAASRRKLTMLTTKTDRLEYLLKGLQEQSKLQPKEIRKRDDLLLGLRYKTKEMASLLGPPAGTSRSSASGAQYAPVETHRTANVDNRGIVALQHQMIQEQDDELMELESSVANTKHIAMTINGELDLQKHLLEDIDADLQSTSSRMKMVKRKLGFLSRNADRSCGMCCVMLVATGLIFVALLVYALLKVIW